MTPTSSTPDIGTCRAMASKALHRLPRDWLGPSGMDALAVWFGPGGTCGDLVSGLPDALCLAEVAGVSWPRAADFLAKVSSLVTPSPASALELYAASRPGGAGGGFLATGLPVLDKALSGGLRTGTIVELVGETGVGKSQFAMTVAARAPLPVEYGGLAGGVVFVDTEGKFSAERLLGIVSQLDAVLGDPARGKQRRDAILGAVTVVRAKDSAELRSLVDDVEAAVARSGARLVVIDSIAALARRDFDQSTLRERQGELSRLASSLKHVAEAYRLLVLVTNQVAGRMSPEEAGPMPGGSVRPALGTTWSHCVNTRLVLQHLPGAAVVGGRGAEAGGAGGDALRAAASGGVRTVSVAKSPVAPCVSDSYVIARAGVVAIPPGCTVVRAEGSAASATGGEAGDAGSTATAAMALAGGGMRPPARDPGDTAAAADEESEDVFLGLSEAELAALEGAGE